jgi:hydrogenase expression/formation protein HypC
MCRAVPTQITRIDGDVGWVEQDGAEQAISLLGVDDVAVGDYVFHHAGLALGKIEPDEAQAILAALDELEALYLAEEQAEAMTTADGGLAAPSSPARS